MRKLIAILLLLGGCSGADEPVNEAVALSEELLANLDSAAPGDDPAQLRALIDRAMPVALPDVPTPHYRNVRAGVGGAACGEVAASEAGPYRNFVVTPEAAAVVGEEPGVRFNDPSDFLADAWIRWCASPEELAQVEAQLRAGPAPDVGTSTDLSGTPPALVAEPAAPAPAPTPIVRRPPPPAPRIDSFSQSVSRPEG